MASIYSHGQDWAAHVQALHRDPVLREAVASGHPEIGLRHLARALADHAARAVPDLVEVLLGQGPGPDPAGADPETAPIDPDDPLAGGVSLLQSGLVRAAWLRDRADPERRALLRSIADASEPAATRDRVLHELAEGRLATALGLFEGIDRGRGGGEDVELLRSVAHALIWEPPALDLPRAVELLERCVRGASRSWPGLAAEAAAELAWTRLLLGDPRGCIQAVKEGRSLLDPARGQVGGRPGAAPGTEGELHYVALKAAAVAGFAARAGPVLESLVESRPALALSLAADPDLAPLRPRMLAAVRGGRDRAALALDRLRGRLDDDIAGAGRWLESAPPEQAGPVQDAREAVRLARAAVGSAAASGGLLPARQALRAAWRGLDVAGGGALEPPPPEEIVAGAEPDPRRGLRGLVRSITEAERARRRVQDRRRGAAEHRQRLARAIAAAQEDYGGLLRTGESLRSRRRRVRRDTVRGLLVVPALAATAAPIGALGGAVLAIPAWFLWAVGHALTDGAVGDAPPPAVLLAPMVALSSALTLAGVVAIVRDRRAEAASIGDEAAAWQRDVAALVRRACDLRADARREGLPDAAFQDAVLRDLVDRSGAELRAVAD
ncbi:hypothetical protein L6R50_24020 [Myxococcota bacterium]|nr:hypothetical protein [Myxococcota bacterium]